MNDILDTKLAANAYLPRLAEGYVRGELDLADLVTYFTSVAHLYTVGIDVNAICNLTCDYCYLAKYNRSSVPTYVPLETLFRFLEDVAARGVDLVALVGKEPFADERGIETLQFLNLLSKHGGVFRYGVVTNGTLLDRYIDRLPESIAYLDISLDGVEAINDRARGRGVFRTATSNVSLALKAGYEVWISSVLHSSSGDPERLGEFVRMLSGECGCRRFYFSPVRNFTGTLQPFLLSFDDIARLQDSLVEVAEQISGIDTLILDHPYEAVWRDYIWPVASGAESRLDVLTIDEFGNLLEQLTPRCYRKLDVFPHGPWGTCRIDAAGQYLWDVESRTHRKPAAVGSILDGNLAELHSDAVTRFLEHMLRQFLDNMRIARGAHGRGMALRSVSIPTSRRISVQSL